MQIYNKVFLYGIMVVALAQGCSKDLAPQTVLLVPGKSERKINREKRRRAWVGYWYKRRNERVTRKSERQLNRLEKKSRRAEAKMQQDHIKKQTPAVQKRMKETKKEAEQNNPRRNLRQRLRLWRYKK